MKREDYEKHKPFAGEKKPSMLRRRLDHDYESRRIYLITMTVEGRRPLLGRLVGNADAPEGSPDEPRVCLSQLGEEVQRCWLSIPDFYPEVKPLALQLMPDHLHGILFVTRQMEQHLGMVLKGFKAGCNKAYRQLFRAAENGLHPLSKPGPERFRACSEGRLLLLSPFPHHNERITITRAACEALNGLAWDISGGK